MKSFIRIVNWERFQHYKDRNPPWIKLHRELLTSETWVSCSDADRVLAIAIMMLAAATENKIPADPRYVERAAYLNAPPDFARLIEIGFIEIIGENGEPLADASTPQADASAMHANARPEKRQSRAETEAEKRSSEAKASGAAAPASPDEEFWATGTAYLAANGMKAPHARSLLGKFRKQHGEDAVRSALVEARARAVSEPAAWLTKRLAGTVPHGRAPPLERKVSATTGIAYVKDPLTGEWIQDLGLG